MESEEARCPSCGDAVPPGAVRCQRCDAPVAPSTGGGGQAGRDLPGDAPSPPGAGRDLAAGAPLPRGAGHIDRPDVPVEYEVPGDRNRKKLLEPGEEIKVDRGDMLEKETYMCLICGSIVPALADKCPICGTIFVSETESRTFSGIPVARVARRGAPEPPGTAVREVPVAGETARLDLPVPRSLSATALREADVLPVVEHPDTRRVVVKKKVLRKRLRKD